jgi:hypothetical protein
VVGKKAEKQADNFKIKMKKSIFILDSRGKVYSHSEGECFELFKYFRDSNCYVECAFVV